MKRLFAFIGGLAGVLAIPLAFVLADVQPAPTPGLDFIAKANGSTNSASYLVKIQADLEAQGLAAMQQALYDAGNARSRTLAQVHPRTRAAILYLLQLDGWIPDGSGTPPPAFDPSIADARIEGLGNVIPR
jgi:hypothetical protein